MKRLWVFAFFLLFGFVAVACDDEGGSANASRSARDLIVEMGKAQNCAMALVTGTCSADGKSIAEIRCMGEVIQESVPCPSGMVCKALDEMSGLVPYCVPEEKPAPECIVSTCDKDDSQKLKVCKSGKYVVEACGKGMVCQTGAKDATGKNLGASCEKSVTDQEEEFDPCKLSGHGEFKSSACSTSLKEAIYTCSDGHVIVEGCGPTVCEAVNFYAYLDAKEKDPNTPESSLMIIKVMKLAFPNIDMHGCQLSVALEILDLMLEDMDGIGI